MELAELRAERARALESRTLAGHLKNFLGCVPSAGEELFLARARPCAVQFGVAQALAQSRLSRPFERVLSQCLFRTPKTPPLTSPPGTPKPRTPSTLVLEPRAPLPHTPPER